MVDKLTLIDRRQHSAGRTDVVHLSAVPRSVILEGPVTPTLVVFKGDKVPDVEQCQMCPAYQNNRFGASCNGLRVDDQGNTVAVRRETKTGSWNVLEGANAVPCFGKRCEEGGIPKIFTDSGEVYLARALAVNPMIDANNEYASLITDNANQA
ncbi:MAG: hypothetical protein WCJ70_00010 [bacterium]